MRPAFAIALCLGSAIAAAADADREGIDFFEKRIRPVLVERCYECHSGSAKKVEGSLLLDTKEGLRKGGDLGPAIVPGDSEKSLLIQAIRYSDENLQMPPKDKGRLPKEVVADQLPGRQTWMPFRFQLKNLLSPLPSMAVPGWAWFFS